MKLALKISQQQEQSQKNFKVPSVLSVCSKHHNLGDDGVFFLLGTSECAAVRAASLERESCTSLVFMLAPADVHSRV